MIQDVVEPSLQHVAYGLCYLVLIEPQIDQI